MGVEGKDVDPAEVLRRIESESARARRALSPEAHLLYSIWGTVWLAGFLMFFCAAMPTGKPLLPWWLALAMTAVLVGVAIVVSTLHSVRRSRGARGPSVVQGAIYGNCFALCFLFAGLLGWRLWSAGLGTAGLLSYGVAVSCLIIGALVVAGALLWDEKSQLIFGTWILLVGLGSLAVPGPYVLLAGAAAGAGLLVLGVLHGLRPALVSGRILRTSHA